MFGQYVNHRCEPENRAQHFQIHIFMFAADALEMKSSMVDSVSYLVNILIIIDTLFIKYTNMCKVTACVPAKKL